MSKEKRRNPFYIAGLISGVLAVITCIVVIALSVSDSYISIYLLCTALVLLGLNRIGLHVVNYKENMFENIFLTVFIFALAILLGLTKYNIYFLITTMFLYSLTIVVARLLNLRKDKSVRSIIYNSLCMVFYFLFSFVFFFPEIYAKHATSVSNSNFMVLCFAIVILASSGKNLLFPYHKELKINVINKVIKKSMVYEIILALLIFVILCSIYFTIVEPNMTSYVDSLWYCFAVITTIGFGDVYVTTTLGRILSVILGIGGIAVVALFTSIIVNFYNEMNHKKDYKKVEKIEKEIERVEEEEKEILNKRDF